MVAKQRINHLAKNLYKKAYLLEFMNENGTGAEAAFTFSVPPESEELSYPQRKTETKTFGGLHVDDYGIDTVKISLSGSTVNEELKLIYDPNSAGEELTGEQEIYRLRDLIKEWKSGSVNIKRKIMLYDLSKMGKGEKAVIPNYWRVFPGELKIRRSSEKPFTYKYTIDFTGVDPAAEDFKKSMPKGEGIGGLNPVIKALRTALEAMREAMTWWDNLLSSISPISLIDNVLNQLNEVSSLLSDMGNILKYASSTIPNMMKTVGDTASGFIGSITNVVGGVHDVVEGIHTVISLPRTIQIAAVNIGLDVYNATTNLMKETTAMVDECRKMFDPESGYWDIPQEILNQYEMTNAEFKDTIAIMCDDVENAANETVVAAKSAIIPAVSAGVPDPATGVQRLVLSYGDSAVTLKQTDTLESLAAQYYGSPDNAIDIATYNRIASIDELSPGDTIRIPILTKAQRNSNNRIYARPEDRDNYGRDIALTDEGGILASTSGDYKLTDGVNNLNQAVLLRLRERVNKRIRLNAYGIRTNISDPAAGVAYILSSIDLTMRSDPRVKEIGNIGFSGQGDYLNVVVDYTDINNTGNTIRRRV